MRAVVAIAARGAVFALPIVALLGGALGVLSRTGELAALDLESAVAAQRTAPAEALFGPAYSDCTPRYKLLMTTAARAEVLAMGSSRAMEIRGELFRASFYNAGGATLRAPDPLTFLSRIPREAQPRVIILALDQFTLSDAVDRDETQELGPRLDRCIEPVDLVLNNWTAVYRDVLARKIPFAALTRPEFTGLGIAAQVDGRGFRRDGSNRPGRHGTQPFAEVLDRIARNNYRFQHDTEVSSAMAAKYEAFLAEATRRGIHVAAFLPPYAPLIIDKMKETGGYAYVWKIHESLSPTFERGGHVLADFTDTRDLGLTDENFIDGFHGSERAYTHIIQELALRDPVVAGVVDAERIGVLLQTHDPITVVGGI